MKRIILLMLLAAVFLTACKNEGKTDQGVRVSPAPKGTEAEKPGAQTEKDLAPYGAQVVYLPHTPDVSSTGLRIIREDSVGEDA